MKSLRDYLDIITQLDERVSIGPDGKVTGGIAPPPAASAPAAPAAAPAKMADGGPPPTPEQLKWLGGADKTDPFILARMRKAVPNAPAASAPAAPAAAPAASAPAAPAAAPALTAADQEDADMGAAMTANAQAATQAANGVNAAGQNVTMPDGTNPETGEKTTVASAAPAAPEQAAKPTAPGNRDAMPFGKAFADAKAKGEKTFMWKGKSYAVQMAAPAQGAKKTAPALPGKTPFPGATGTMGASDPMTGMPYSPMAESSNVSETTGYDEVQRLVSLVQHR